MGLLGASRIGPAVLIGLAIGCVESVRPPRPPPPPEVIAAPAPPPPPPSGPEHTSIDRVEPQAAALLPSGELIAGRRDALVALQADGASYRVLSAGAALFPRRFGRDHALVLRPLLEHDLRDGFALDLITLETGERRELAQVPAFRCAEGQPATLSIEEPTDFEVDPRHGVACLGLTDAVSTRAQVRVRVRVDLRAPRIERWLALGEHTCTPPEAVPIGDPAPDGSCWENSSVVRPLPDGAAFPFAFHEEHVRMPAAPRGGQRTRLRGYQVEEVSPSGRWMLLAGDFIEREVVYRRLVLLDRGDGKLYPIPSLPGSWPPPLTAAGGQVRVPVREADLFAAAADVRWAAFGQVELLLLDTRVVRPGERTFDITEGTFAR